MRYLASISYDGSHFYGFQRLNNGLGVQNELERVLSIIAKERVRVHGSGRTDRGVHAYMQCIHFDLDIDISLDKLKYVMNRLLNSYVVVNNLQVVRNNFHARHDVYEKTYLYKVYVGEKNPFLSDYAYMTRVNFDLEKMQEAAKYFEGEHDFKAFKASGTSSKSSVRIIYKAEVYQKEDKIWSELTGNGFLYNMVRIIAGTLVDVGTGKIKPEDIEKIIESKDRTNAGKTLPPQGLYLVCVNYNN